MSRTRVEEDEDEAKEETKDEESEDDEARKRAEAEEVQVRDVRYGMETPDLTLVSVVVDGDSFFSTKLLKHRF